jgi:hypothetical protein
MAGLAATSQSEPVTAPFTETLSASDVLGGDCSVGPCRGTLDLVHG